MKVFRIQEKLFIAVLASLVSACSAQPNSSALQSQNLSTQQALEDYDAMTATFQSMYGPLTYKETRFGFTLDALTQQYRQAVSSGASDVDTFAAIKAFLSSFRDGHVSIDIPGSASHIKSYDLPIILTPVEGKALVAETLTSAELSTATGGAGIAVGDELVTVDGTSPFDLLPIITKYNTFATDLSNQHWIVYALRRPFYMKELVPTKAEATLDFARADGSTYAVVLPWTQTSDDPGPAAATSDSITDFTVYQSKDLFRGAEGSLLTMGAVEPFFNSAAVKSGYNFEVVTPNDDYLTKYGLTAATAPTVFSVLYRYKAKTILLVRQPNYEPVSADAALAAYRAILDQYQAFADVLVIDQTENPGGSLDYADSFFALFATGQESNLVQHMHADRKWVYDFQQAADSDAAQMPTFAAQLTDNANAVDQAIDAGVALTAPLPLTGFEHISPDAAFSWTKPILVLADELSGSCGDIFPMLMQRNGAAKIFGRTTMGLGGNVEPLITLPNSQAVIHVTRGLYTTFRNDGSYSDADLMENNGVTPDVEYTISAADFRAGFVAYVGAFSDAAIAQIPPAPAASTAAAN